MIDSTSVNDAATPPLEIRKRPDLSVKTARYEGRTFYLIKDPIGLKYLRFRPEEHAILQLLDGRRSLPEIQAAFAAEFRPRKISTDDLLGYIGRLQDAGLLINETPGQTRVLLERSQQQQRRRRAAASTNFLYVKLPGVDPERFLNWLHPKVRWVYSPAGVFAAVALMLAALTLVIVNFDEFQSRPELARFHSFFNVYNIVWLWLALAVAKMIHEIGHGLTCTHFGGECHEMGLLFLVFSPCMYADVSDAWMLPNKWHRIAISAAGIYVEVVLASIATFVWWYTEPGLIHNLAFSTLIVCSVSTILFNANPLMRFDGYYVLSDLLEIPNLRGKASRLVQQFLVRWCLGIDVPRQADMPQSRRWLFAVYAVSAYIYRWLITVAILFFLYTFLQPYKLGAISIALSMLVLTSLVVSPLLRLSRKLFQTKEPLLMNKLRLATTAFVLAGLIAGTLFVPIPLRVATVLTVEPSNVESVFVSVPGTLKSIYVEAGQRVRSGEPLIQLTNNNLRLQRLKLQRQVELHDVAARTFEALDKRGRAEQARLTKSDARQQLANRDRELDRLTLRSPRDGVILPPPELTVQAANSPNAPLANWSGVPLDDANLGSQLPVGTLICQIGHPDQMEAVLVIDQSDIEFVQIGSRVSMKFDAFPDKTLTGTIQEIAYQELESTPRQLSTRLGGELPTKVDQSGEERPFQASYQARVALDHFSERLQPGFRGRARIGCGTRTAAAWLTRSISELFRFRM